MASSGFYVIMHIMDSGEHAMKDSYDLKRLSIADKDLIQYFFKEVFTKEPWNDDWSGYGMYPPLV